MCCHEKLPQLHRRYMPSKQSKCSIQKGLLAAAMLILAFCGIFLLLHFVLLDSHEKNLRSEVFFTSEKAPQTGLLEVNQCQSVCYTRNCIKTAAKMLDVMEPTVNPCEDFYKYACGRYVVEPMGNNAKKESITGEVERGISSVLQSVIKQIPKSTPDHIPGFTISKVRKFYESCMNPISSEGTAISTAFRYLEYFGIRNWPNMNVNFNFSYPDLYEVIVRLYLYDENPLFYMQDRYIPLRNQTLDASSCTEPGDCEMFIMMIFRRYGMLHCSRIEKKKCKQRIKGILDYFVPQEARTNKILDAVWSLDQEFLDLIKNASDRSRTHRMFVNGTYRRSPFSYDCAQQESDYMLDKWCSVARIILDRSGFSKKNPNTSFFLEDREYFHDLGNLVSGKNQWKMAHMIAINFFLKYTILMNFGLRRTTEFSQQELKKEYFDEIYERKCAFCAMWTSYRLPVLAAAAYYSTEWKNSEFSEEISKLFLDLKETTLSTVRGTSWVDSEAKKSLEDLFTEKINFSLDVYHKYISNISAVDEHFKEVEITEEDFLANELECDKLKAISGLQTIGNRAKKNVYETYPFYFNPHYDSSTFTINFQLGSFVFPFFAVDRPRYINLGPVGVTMGHELGHTIEIFLGTFENKSEMFENAYKERTECLEDHFWEYEIELIGEKVKGNITFAENMAEYFGYRGALKSLKNYQERHGHEERLPGLQFTNQQMFFIAAAQEWCEKNTVESLRDYLGDVHSPGKVRVLGSYKNLDAFSEAFNCPLGSSMNPARKCRFE